MPHPRDTGNGQSYCRESGGRSEYRCRCLRDETFRAQLPAGAYQIPTEKPRESAQPPEPVHPNG